MIRSHSAKCLHARQDSNDCRCLRALSNEFRLRSKFYNTYKFRLNFRVTCLGIWIFSTFNYAFHLGTHVCVHNICIVRSPVSAIHAHIQLHIGDVFFVLYGEHFLTFGATFFPGTTFVTGKTFFWHNFFTGAPFLSCATFFSRATFFLGATFFLA